MKLSYQTLNLPLANSFTTHKATLSYAKFILVKLTWEGLDGYGIASPIKEYGMNEQTLQDALEKFQSVLNGASPFEFSFLLQKLRAISPTQPSALAAIDTAMYDLIGKKLEIPLYQYLGLENLTIPNTSISVGIMPISAAMSFVAQYLDWPILKIKMSGPNVELIRQIRQIYTGRLWVDANGAWTPQQAIKTAEELYRYDIELIEQPIFPGSHDQLRHVSENSPIAIFADEDCLNAHDVMSLGSCCKGVCIKLVKCGGLAHAIEMIQLARQMDLKIMLGCVTESVIGTTAITQLSGLADLLDVDGHLDITDEPCSGIQITRGKVTLPKQSGIGIAWSN